MQVFKTYFKILKKQLTSILIYAGLFLGLTIIFTNNSGNSDNQFVTSEVPVMVINEDGENELIQGFLDYLEQYAFFVEPKESEKEAKDALYNRSVVYLLTIPQGFTKGFLKNENMSLVKMTAPNSMEAITIDTAIDNYFNMAKVYQSYVTEIDNEQLNAYVKANLREQTKVSVGKEGKETETTGNTHNRFYYNYLGYILIAVFITSVSTVMFSFHGLEIRRKHSASPMSNRYMNLQLLIANLIFVLAYLLIFIIVGYLLDANKIINMNTILFWLNAITFTIVALSISYLVGISVSSKKAIAALSTGISLALAFLSGMFVPQEFLGAPVLKVASFTPAYWFVKANNSIETLTANGWASMSGVVSDMAIQLGFAAAIISVALVVSKRKTQQTS